MAFFRAKRAIGGGGNRVQTGSITGSRNDVTVTVGFKPKKLYVYDVSKAYPHSCIYDEDASTTQFLRNVYSGSGSTVAWTNIGVTSATSIRSISNTGFTFRGNGYATNYVAIG